MPRGPPEITGAAVTGAGAAAKTARSGVPPSSDASAAMFETYAPPVPAAVAAEGAAAGAGAASGTAAAAGAVESRRACSAVYSVSDA